MADPTPPKPAGDEARPLHGGAPGEEGAPDGPEISFNDIFSLRKVGDEPQAALLSVRKVPEDVERRRTSLVRHSASASSPPGRLYRS